MLQTVIRKPDTWLGLAALLGGSYLALMAWGLGARAGHFPFWLSIILALCGLGILVQAIRSSAPTEIDGASVLFGALPFAGVILLWVLAVTYGLGYVIPGFFCGMALLFIAGERRPVRIAVGAAVLIVVCYVFFSVVFNVRLPEIQLIADMVRPIRRLIH